jgi:hypothetical protein
LVAMDHADFRPFGFSSPTTESPSMIHPKLSRTFLANLSRCF